MTTTATLREIRVGETRSHSDPRRGFRSYRDFLLAVIAHSTCRDASEVTDERLRPLVVTDSDDRPPAGRLAFMLPAAFTPGSLRAAAGSDEQGTYSDPYGGFAVPRSGFPGVLGVGFGGDPTAGRTLALPMPTPVLDVPARVDANHTTSVAGGLVVYRRPETSSATPTRMAMQMISLRASTLMGAAFATEELIADAAPAFVAVIEAGFRDQSGARMLHEKLFGSGAGELMGVVGAPATIVVAKEGGQSADTIVAENVINMAARCWGYSTAIWLANYDTRVQLARAALVVETDVGLVRVFQPAQRDGDPDMLWGRPIYFTELCATVGDIGDLVLGNWSQYLDCTYRPFAGAESVHVRYENHERALKFWTRNAGAPWWSAKLTPKNSTTTLSPFVVLAERAG